MAEKKNSQNDFNLPSLSTGQTLRRKAEKRLKKQSPARGTKTPEEIGRLLHELQVHQIELEMQNEELRRAQVESELLRTRYFVLYDQAPVGYLTLSEKGMILEANLTAADLLGETRSALLKQPLSRFILPEGQDLYYWHRKKLLETNARQVFEIRMKKKDGTPFYVLMESTTVQALEGPPVFRVIMSDITEFKRIEEKLRESEVRHRHQVLATQENERKRIALEVHDVLGSSLMAIKLKTEEALQHLSNDQFLNIAKPLKALLPLVQETIEQARRIQADLRPSLLDDLGIKATLSWFCRRFETIHPSIRVEQAVTIHEEEVPDHLKISLFRIAQEATNNIGKHAKADSVYLGLRKVNGHIELCIKDNGEGFDPESLSSRDSLKNGLGLTSMKERAELSGGTFSIESARGKGTVIRAVWPV